MPPQDRATGEDAYLESMIMKLFTGEGLGEGISELVLGVDVCNPELITSYLIPDKKEVNGNMFHATMEDGVGTDIGGTNIVIIDDR